MLSRWIRTWDYRLLRPVLSFLVRLGITPNSVTVSSLMIISLSGLLFAFGHMILGGGLLVVGACLDGLDGELARVLHQDTRFGAFLDSISDHYSDFAVYLGLLLLYLSREAHVEIVLVFLALFGSMLGSQVRSRAGMLGIDAKSTGIFTRFERMLVLLAGIFLNHLVVSLCILAVMNNVSALQRLALVVQANRIPRKVSNP